MNLARLCARLKPVFLSKKGPSKAHLLTKMSSSEELGTLVLVCSATSILCLLCSLRHHNIAVVQWSF